MQRLTTTITLCALLWAGAAAAQCTENVWQGGAGDWSDGPGWSLAAEPTSDHCATIADGAVVDVSLPGETCAELSIGAPDDPTSSLQIWGTGDLSVTGLLTLGDGGVGSVAQYHGACSAGSVEIGIGGYTIGGGTFTAGALTVGTSAIIASFNPTGGQSTVTGDLTLEPQGLVVVGSGRLQVDGTLVVGGRFAVTGGLSPALEAAALSVVPGGVFAPTVTTFGYTPLVVSGTAALGGTLSVTDFEAPDGVYDVIVAGGLTGDFDFVQLPNDDWSWGVDGDTVWIEKDAPTASEAATWGEVKALYGLTAF